MKIWLITILLILSASFGSYQLYKQSRTNKELLVRKTAELNECSAQASSSAELIARLRADLRAKHQIGQSEVLSWLNSELEKIALNAEDNDELLRATLLELSWFDDTVIPLIAKHGKFIAKAIKVTRWTGLALPFSHQIINIANESLSYSKLISTLKRQIRLFADTGKKVQAAFAVVKNDPDHGSFDRIRSELLDSYLMQAQELSLSLQKLEHALKQSADVLAIVSGYAKVLEENSKGLLDKLAFWREDSKKEAVNDDYGNLFDKTADPAAALKRRSQSLGALSIKLQKQLQEDMNHLSTFNAGVSFLASLYEKG